MKPASKISFTSVLKSKNISSRQTPIISTSSQLSSQQFSNGSQGLYPSPQSQRLIDIF
jgi:hypothetical protein